MEKEVWKDIIGYEGLYQVSNMGKVKSLNYLHTKKERILKQNNVGGYSQVQLCKEGKRKVYNIHRLVAQAFLPNPDNLPCVNHKDENKQNNHISNLEFCTHQYNVNYGTAIQRMAKANSISHKGLKQSQEHITNHSSSVRIPIVQYDLDNKLIGIYESTKQASEVLGIDNSGIVKCLKGKYKTCNGYKWKYLQDFLIELKKAS